LGESEAGSEVLLGGALDVLIGMSSILGWRLPSKAIISPLETEITSRKKPT
jgi:hypothetical protein